MCPPQGRGASRGTHGQLQEPLDDPGIIHVLQGIGSRHPCPTVTREEGRQGPGCPGGGGARNVGGRATWPDPGTGSGGRTASAPLRPGRGGASAPPPKKKPPRGPHHSPETASWSSGSWAPSTGTENAAGAWANGPPPYPVLAEPPATRGQTPPPWVMGREEGAQLSPQRPPGKGPRVKPPPPPPPYLLDQPHQQLDEEELEDRGSDRAVGGGGGRDLTAPGPPISRTPTTPLFQGTPPSSSPSQGHPPPFQGQLPPPSPVGFAVEAESRFPPTLSPNPPQAGPPHRTHPPPSSHHLKEAPEEETLADAGGAGKVQLVAQGGREEKVVEICEEGTRGDRRPQTRGPPPVPWGSEDPPGGSGTPPHRCLWVALTPVGEVGRVGDLVPPHIPVGFLGWERGREM